MVKDKTSHPPQGRVSIRDVAARAGVSVGTVSNTINRPDSVRKITRDAVLRAIDDLHFVPNQQARILSGVSSPVIGLIVLDVRSPFFMEIADAVEKVANSRGQLVILSSSDNDQKKEARILGMLEAHTVRGVLLTPASISSRFSLRDPETDPVPVVYVDVKMPPTQCSVSVDNIAGARMATRHLLELGCTRVAFVGDSEVLHQFADRSKGVQQALKKAGHDLARSFVEVKVPGIGIQDGIVAGEILLQESPIPTGILCGNDMMAFGVYRALSGAGVRIPEDVALIGYDDIDFAADWILPLTSVRQPTGELGRRAAELLMEHSANDPQHVHKQIVLRPELIIRSSTDPRSVGSSRNA